MSKLSKDDDYYRRRQTAKLEHLPFDVESWYPRLREHTFATWHVPLTPDEARAITNYYRRRFIATSPEARSYRCLTVEYAQTLRALEARIDQLLREASAECASASPSFFVRLSSRSPKDAPPWPPSRLSASLDAQLAAVDEREASLRSAARERLLGQDAESSAEALESAAQLAVDNARMIAVAHAQFDTLALSTAEEAMHRICTSERVFVDLLLALDNCELDDDQWSVNVIVRRWDDRVRDDYEFRGFVCRDRLVAISQYNHYCYYEQLQAEQARIRAAIETFWPSVHPLVAMNEYVMDFAVLRGSADGKLSVRIIELNPFATTTGGALFNWSRDHDLLYALDEERQLEMRVLAAPHRSIGSLVEESQRFVREICGKGEDARQQWQPYTALLDEIEKEHCEGGSPGKGSKSGNCLVQ